MSIKIVISNLQSFWDRRPATSSKKGIIIIIFRDRMLTTTMNA